MEKKRTKNNVVMQLLAVMAVLTMLLLADLRVYAAEAKQAGIAVTRLEWLKELTQTFEMTVEEDNYPDNYYSDIDSGSEDYYDVMLATEFGLVDVEAGGALRPGDVATREFAAHTLNLCLGYVLEEETYTYSEAAAVTYPEDIQIAVNRGWFALSDGKFLPDQAVTQEEKDAMIAAARETLAQSGDGTGGGSYTFRENVIVLPEETVLESVDEDTFSIENCPAEIKAGDIFGKVCDGTPLAWRAGAVRVSGSQTIITAGMVDSEEAFGTAGVNQAEEVDLTKLEPASADASLRYVVGGTQENNFDDGIVCESLEEAGEREVHAVLVEQSTDLPKSRKSFNIGDAKVKLTAKITNLTWDHGHQRGKAYIDFAFDVDFNCNVSVDFLEMAGISPSYDLFYAQIIPGVYVKGVADLSFYGEANARLVEHIDLGFHYENSAPRLVRRFCKDSFTITAKATASAGVRLEAGFKIPGLSGKIYGKVGTNITAKAVRYTDGQKPESCQTISAYLYASAGYDVSVDVVIYKDSLASANKDIYTKYNSPVRVAYHFEDGAAVSKCTRKTPGMGYAGWGYFSPINSQYYYAGGSSGGSYENGKVYTIFDYSVDQDNQATITGYRGTAVNVFVPETLDGHPVVGIGQNAFKDNKRIKSVSVADSVVTIGRSAFWGCTALERVTMPENEKFTVIESWAFYNCVKLREIEIPDSVTEIEGVAFANCHELSSVKLSPNLNVLGSGTFGNCDKITSIRVPKSLKSCEGNGGPFENCDGLKQVEFEEGTVTVAKNLLNGCTGLEKIKIPDTVTTIEDFAFWGCVNLRQVQFSTNLTKIGTWAFKGCIELSDVVLPRVLEILGGGTFENCDNITNIKIPKSLKSCEDNGAPFENCDGLKEVKFEEGITEITERLFFCCTGLSEIEIPNTVTIIKEGAFRECSNLKRITFSENLAYIESWAFYNCVELESVILPDEVVEIDGFAFSNCEKLSNVKLPKRLETLDSGSFQNCDNITNIEVPKSLKNTNCIGGPFENCDGLKEIIFENGTEEIVRSLFEGCTGLEKIKIPDTVTVIGQSAFRKCSNLKQVTFNKSLAKIEAWAFWDCKSLESIEMPDSVSEIGANMFQDCVSLKKAIISDTVMSIGDNTFSGCTSLQKVHIPNTQKTITQNMFYGCSSLAEINLPETLTRIEANAFYNCDALTELNLPARLESIGSNAFNDCDALIKIIMPASLTQMDDHAFYHCDNLAEVSLGTGLTALPTYAFAQCPKLTSIVLPYRMMQLNNYAFNACTGLTEITMPRSMANIGSQVFSYPGKMTIYGISGTYAETYAKEKGITFVNREVKASGVRLSQDEMRIGKGKRERLFLTVEPANFTDKVNWKSGNEKIATVSEDGEVTAVSCGTTNIKVTVGNASASCNVTVFQPVTSIRLSQSSATMAAGDTLSLTASVYPRDATDQRYRWSSSNPAVASVNENGEVTAQTKGEAEITAAASDGSGVTASCKVSVTTQMYIITDVAKLQSPHPYENNCSDSWLYRIAGASKISVTFSQATEAEDGFDFIYLYDKDNKLVGTYTGRALAGKTISITGDTIRIKLVTDDGGTAYGFAVTKAVKETAPGNPSGTGGTSPGTGGNVSEGNKNPTPNPPKKTVKKPSVTKVKSFKAKAGKKKLSLSWKKISGAAGYQLQISLKSNFKKAKTISVSKSKKSYTKNGLKAKKKYYLRIRAYKTYKDAKGKKQKSYGKWVKISKRTK